MKPKHHPKKPFKTRWERGFSALGRAFLLLAVVMNVFQLSAGLCWALVYWLGEPLSNILGIILVVVTSLLLLLYIPAVVSQWNLDPVSIREEFVASLDPNLDALAIQLGVQWEEHYSVQVDKLLRDGQRVAARRLYREKTGKSWDQIDWAITHWDTTLMKEKLLILETAAKQFQPTEQSAQT